MPLKALLGGLLLLLASAVGLVGCGSPSGRAFDGRYETLAVAEAPPGLKVAAENLKAAPGLYVFREGGETYLLLTVGRQTRAGLDLRVLSVQKAAPKDQEVRILAVLSTGKGEDPYPAVLLKLKAGKDVQFRGRVTLGEEIVEYRGLPQNQQ